MMKTQHGLRVDWLYVYVSRDGVARQRCGRHVHCGGNELPLFWIEARRLREWACIECYYESLEKDAKHDTNE